MVKKNLIFGIILGIVGIALLTVGIFITTRGTKDVKEKNSESKVSSINSAAKKMIINGNSVEASLIILTEDNKLYAYGDIIHEDILDKPKELATNVKDFNSNLSTILYTDLNDNLYARSIMPSIGESDDKFSPLATNVDKFNLCGIDGVMVLDNDKNYYMQVSDTGSMHCGVHDTYAELTKINFIDNITDLGASSGFSSLLLPNGDLYEADVTAVREKRSDIYIKILSNVKEIKNNYVLTNNNEIYYMNDYGMYNHIDKVATNGKKIFSDYYETNDNKFHFAGYNNQGLYINDIEKEDIKEILYGIDLTKLVYIDTNNKLVLSTETETKKLDFNPSSMKEVYDFIKEKIA